MKKNYLKIALKGNRYSYKEASIQEMAMLGCFLTSEVLCFGSTFKEWALDNNDLGSYGGNIIELEKEDKYIVLSEQMFQKVKKGPYFAIQQSEFVKLLEIWKIFAIKTLNQNKFLLSMMANN